MSETGVNHTMSCTTSSTSSSGEGVAHIDREDFSPDTFVPAYLVVVWPHSKASCRERKLLGHQCVLWESRWTHSWPRSHLVTIDISNRAHVESC